MNKPKLWLPDWETVQVSLAFVVISLATGWLINHVNPWADVTPTKWTVLVGFVLWTFVSDKFGILKDSWTYVDGNKAAIVISELAFTELDTIGVSGPIEKDDEKQGLRIIYPGTRGLRWWLGERIFEDFDIFDPEEIPLKGLKVNDKKNTKCTIEAQILGYRSAGDLIRLKRIGEKTSISQIEEKAKQALQTVTSKIDARSVSGQLKQLADLSKKFEREFFGLPEIPPDPSKETKEINAARTKIAQEFGIRLEKFTIAVLELPSSVTASTEEQDRIDGAAKAWTKATGRKKVPANLAAQFTLAALGGDVLNLNITGGNNLGHLAIGELGRQGKGQKNQNQGGGKSGKQKPSNPRP